MKKKEVTIYYGKCANGTYDILINIDGQDVENAGGLSEEGLKLTFREHPDAILIDTNSLDYDD